MSRLLDQSKIDAMVAVAHSRVQRNLERVRGVMYQGSAPPGFVNLDTPEKVRTFTRYLSRQSEREQRGVVLGNLNQAVAGNPSVQAMAQAAGDMESEALSAPTA